MKVGSRKGGGDLCITDSDNYTLLVLVLLLVSRSLIYEMVPNNEVHADIYFYNDIRNGQVVNI